MESVVDNLNAGRSRLKLGLWLLILSGCALLPLGVVSIFHYFSAAHWVEVNDPYSDYYNSYGYTVHPYPWWTFLVVWAVGLCAIVIGCSLRAYYFTHVIGIGEVVGSSYSSWNYGDTYYLRITGRNRVGKTTTESYAVQPKTYYKYNEGDQFNTGRS